MILSDGLHYYVI